MTDTIQINLKLTRGQWDALAKTIRLGGPVHDFAAMRNQAERDWWTACFHVADRIEKKLEETEA